MLFSDRNELLKLYNAINGTSYDDPDLLQVNTLENAVYMSMEFLDSYNKSCHHTVRGDGSRVYSVIHNSGEIRYVRMEIKTEPDRQIGLVEDVTKVTRERMNIEHERDYDTLTGLYNRRAFQRESEKLFREHPEKHNCESSFCS